jgi:hypothetical protein
LIGYFNGFIGRISTLLTGSTAPRFTATGAPLAARCKKNFAYKSACLMANNVRNEGALISLWITASNAVCAWEFVYGMSAVGGSYQFH